MEEHSVFTALLKRKFLAANLTPPSKAFNSFPFTLSSSTQFIGKYHQHPSTNVHFNFSGNEKKCCLGVAELNSPFSQ